MSDSLASKASTEKGIELFLYSILLIVNMRLILLKYIYHPFHVEKIILHWHKTKKKDKILLKIQTKTFAVPKKR